MLDEILFFQTRIFRMFCMEAKISPVEGDELFSKYGIWDYLKDAYDVLHLNGDEYALNDVMEILKAKGAKIVLVTPNMNFEQKTFCADLILTDAIMDMAEEEGITLQEARSKFIKSKAYDALYDFETGLWANGPDYFRAFYKSVA